MNLRRKFVSGGHPRSVEDQEDDERAEHLARVRAARIKAARAQSQWEELVESHLVPRAGWLVHEPTDTLFTIRRGETFEPGKATFLSGEGARLAFFVTLADEVVVLEPFDSPRTWSEVVERKTRGHLKAVR